MKKMASILLIVTGFILIGIGVFLLIQTRSTDSSLVENNTAVLSSVEKGQAFEEFVINSFNNREYILEERVNDQTTREHTSERSKYPDLVFRKRSTQHRFAVECKYRSSFQTFRDELSLEWAKERSIENYNQFAKKQNIDVVVIIGVGDTPSNPKELYAIPLRSLRYPFVKRDYLQQFRVSADEKGLHFSEQAHNVVSK